MNKRVLLCVVGLCVFIWGCAPSYSLMDSDSHSTKEISPREHARLVCFKAESPEECMKSMKYVPRDQTLAGIKVDDQGCPLDSDGDGVPDHLDKCPGTPEGVKVDERGCPLDSDGDGVPDYLDKCPDTPEGMSVDCRGCPLDSDGDGVPDHLDKCPDTPQGAWVDKDGCWTIGDTLFDFDKYAINPEYHPALDQVIAVFKVNPSLKAEIQGHTDNFGTMDYNQTLSYRRAEAVVKYLAQGGVDKNCLNPAGYDFSQPKYSNETAEGRALNRRVEIIPVQ